MKSIKFIQKQVPNNGIVLAVIYVLFLISFLTFGFSFVFGYIEMFWISLLVAGIAIICLGYLHLLNKIYYNQRMLSEMYEELYNNSK